MSFPGLGVGASAMLTAGEWISVIANNVANLQTDGFKRSDATFQDIAYQLFKPFQGNRPGNSPLAVNIGTGVRLNQVINDFTQGPIVTGRNLDIYINGGGFFQVLSPTGEVFYTRYGGFQPKEDGSSGPMNLQLSGVAYTLTNPPITIPGATGLPVVSANGTVTQGTATAGRIQLAFFVNPEGLEQVGDLLFRETGASGPPQIGFPGTAGFGETLDGALEGSNVDLGSELVDLIFASQLFGYGAESFRTGNEELATTIELARTTT